jgi:hypothetical protein
MRKPFVTKFWQEAHQSLPAELRPRYLAQMQAAERWELAIGRVVETFSGARSALSRLFQTKLAH